MGKPRTVVGEDVLAAVRAMLDKSNTSDAKTLKEWAAAWNIPTHTAEGIVGKAIEAGLMTPTSVVRKDMAGRNGWRPAYWISKAATKSKH